MGREELSECNLAVITASPTAGHKRQGFVLGKELRRLGCENNLTEMTLDLADSKGSFWAVAVMAVYLQLQKMPKTYETVIKVLDNPWIREEVKAGVRKTDYSAEVLTKLENSENFDKERLTLFFPTHVMGEQAAIHLLEKKTLEAKIMAFVPDPWERPLLNTMVGVGIPDINNRRYLVVHDEQTAEQIKKIRPGVAVYPLGTLSEPEHTSREKPEIKWQEGQAVHVGIEFSGSEIPKFEEKVKEFIRTVCKQIISGEIRLTIHMMHHKQLETRVKIFLGGLGLGDNANIRLIRNENMDEAIVTRSEYILGEGSSWGEPNAVITKGGEVPLEDRAGQLAVCVYGGGHEGKDIEAGVREGHAIDMRKVDTDLWWKRITDELRRRSGGSFTYTRSLALEALKKIDY